MTQQNKQKSKSIPRIFRSVLASAFGVQSRKNLEEDFQDGNSAVPYIIAGIIFTILFIIAVYTIVQLVLSI